jgi:hypothetical protein
MATEKHKTIISNLVKNGWVEKSFKKNVSNILKDFYENKNQIDELNYILEKLKECRVIPDLWKAYAVDNLLHIEICEVSITNDLTIEKYEKYKNLWWAFDSSDFAVFNVYSINRYNAMSLINFLDLE